MSLRSWIGSRTPTLRDSYTRPMAWIVTAAIFVAVASAAFVLTASATDAPSFCATCHEMGPYVSAWHSGGHRTVGCVECHVDTGLARYTHKFAALQEVLAHFVKRPAFPMSPPVSVPDYRCKRCHPIQRSLPASHFSHRIHVGVSCYRCHADVGHKVTRAALSSAGILAPGATNTPAETVVPVSAAGHIPVVCVRCHDLASTPCALCHTATHEPRGPCDRCHRPGPVWTFSHPPSGDHGFREFPCVRCHPGGFKSFYCTCHGGKPPTGGD